MNISFNYSEDYLSIFSALAERIERNKLLPTDIINRWNNLVEQIENGYDNIHPELDNDLDTFRDPVFTFILDDELNLLPEHDQFKIIIKQIDERFINCTQVHPDWTVDSRKWWENRIPLKAKKKYIDFMGGLKKIEELGITIQCVD
jgi:hypothetical protein